MKFSTKGRYGARLMLELALNYERGPVLLKDVAERQEISEKYLGHLIAPLKASGLINSSRGAHGGYLLAKPPQDISLAEVVQAVEGNLALVECVSSPKVCRRISICVMREIWTQVVDYSEAYPQGIPGSLGEVNYAQLKSGKMTVQGKEIPTGSLSSYAKAVEIANILKEWIARGDFLLTEPVGSLPGAESGYTFRPLKERPC